MIGHLKADHRLDRCWLKGLLGDALHTVLCAAGYNLRWLLRAVSRLGLKGFFVLSALWLLLLVMPDGTYVEDRHLRRRIDQNIQITGFGILSAWRVMRQCC